MFEAVDSPAKENPKPSLLFRMRERLEFLKAEKEKSVLQLNVLVGQIAECDYFIKQLALEEAARITTQRVQTPKPPSGPPAPHIVRGVNK